MQIEQKDKLATFAADSFFAAFLPIDTEPPIP